MGHLNKFLLLMWKNWVLQYRRPIQTVIEILVPVIFSVILVVVRSLVDPELSGPFSFSKAPLYPPILPTDARLLLYSPNTTLVNKVMECVNKSGLFNIEGATDSAQLVSLYQQYSSEKVFAAIHVDSSDKKHRVSIRFPGETRLKSDEFGINNWRTNQIYPSFPQPGPRNPKLDFGAAPEYYREGFLYLLNLFTLSLMMVERGNVSDIGDFEELYTKYGMPLVSTQRYPYPKFHNDPLLNILKSLIGVILMLSFVYSAINTVKAITTEKEKQLKESMKIMGLSNWLHWTAWFVKCFIFLFISSIIMVILLKVKWYSHTDYTLFTYADPTVMLFFMFFYVCATTTFCFAMSSFFSKANTAATVAGLLWFLSYFPYMLTQPTYDGLSLLTKMLLCLGTNSAVAFGFQTMIMFEGTGEGIQWSNIFRQVTPDDTFTLGHAILMLIIDAIMNLLIALYVEAVFPGEFGVPLPWNFPFKASFWRGHEKSYFRDSPTDDTRKDEFFEEEPKNLQAGVEIKKLRKEFGTKIAVKGLSLNMYENQITVLLGHNGAGKTTTMSMLTGMITPTSGVATVSGYDICSEMSKVRDSLGLCPQHNIIFEDLTVSEHLYFFSKLKGLSKNEIKQEINKFLNLLDLEDKRNARSSTLSGGMKRKLCVGIALCGKSKVIMLDEPTAGMDPSARRVLWNLLETQKIGRTMLLSTHFMDEADLLGDRIAIMAGGELQCCGSSFFLKKKYGAGYSLIMDKSKDCDVNKVTNLLKKHIPSIEVHSNIGSELTYLLAENQSSVFENMLKDLELASKQLGVNSYGISLTTLEEVFMKVGADTEHEEYDENNISEKPNVNAKDQIIVDLKLTPSSTSNMGLIRNQFRAMFLKKYTSIIRSKILLIIQILMPTVFLLLIISVNRYTKQTGDLPAMPLTLDQFSKPITLVQQKASDETFYDSYLDLLKDYKSKAVNSSDIVNDILDITTERPNTVRKSYIVGATFDDLNITAWFNNDPFHSPGIATGLVMDAIYRTVVPSGSLEFINAPLPYSANTSLEKSIGFQSEGSNYAFNLAFSMSFVAAFFVLFIVRENVSKSKHLQLVSGVKIWIFWTTAAICDFITYVATITIIIITFLATQLEGFSTLSDIGCILIIFLCFVWSFLPLTYISGFLFSVPSGGYTKMTMIYIFTGCAAFLTVQILQAPALKITYVGDTLHSIFLIVPHYTFASSISSTQQINSLAKICNSFIGQFEPICKNRVDDYFAWESPGIGKNILYSISVGCFLYILLYIHEYQLFSRANYFIEQKCHPKGPESVPDEDSDVAEEKSVIHRTSQTELHRNYTMVIKDLTKYYKKFLGVNGLCLGVKRYECFGLLGVNGAGKTTTFKMMTGDISISYGDSWVNGYSIKSEHQQVQKLIGYCPQFDALLDDMTARESLVMFALLRGIQRSETNALAEYLSREFDFHRHLDKQVKQLSGGNKRKLSTSISLIGDPPVLYLDEPTTGMDPATKRYLWNALCKFRDSGKCIVLTSHSMEECEALCTRLAIMVNGNFKCLGSTQHLKNKFAKGYTLTIKTEKREDDDTDTSAAIDSFVQKNFRGAQLREKHQELITYYITDDSIPWSKMFGIMERGKRGDLKIEDYSLGQSSLEQVFLTFTKYQTERPGPG